MNTNISRLLRPAGSTVALLALLFGGHAQQPAAKKRAPLPIVPLLVEYEYAPEFLMQWINDHPQYTMIEAMVGKGEPPVYQVILTEKASQRRVWYCNVEAKIKSLTQTGREAHLAAIDYKVVNEGEKPPVRGLALRDKHGQAIRWRFLPATVPSERGAGLTPMAHVPGLRLDYRDLGTAAGEGSAVQIGDKVIEAAPWPEISAPPYFVAHRGSISLGRHIGALSVGEETWRIVSAPEDLREGAKWELVNQFGRERRLRVTGRRGEEVTISETGSQAFDPATLSLNARVTAEGLALRSIRLVSQGQTMQIGFTPELDLSPAEAAKNSEVAFQIDQASHQKISHGTVVVEKQDGGVKLRWRPKAPDWARSNALETTVKAEADRYTIKSVRVVR